MHFTALKLYLLSYKRKLEKQLVAVSFLQQAQRSTTASVVTYRWPAPLAVHLWPGVDWDQLSRAIYAWSFLG